MRRRRAGRHESPDRTRLRSVTDVLVLLAALVLVLLGVRFFGPAPETGGARIIDGDSLRLAESEVRLFGIDAPEYRQDCEDQSGRNWPCGKDATQALDQMTRGRAVTCVTEESDRYGRNVATCRTETHDLNAEMVRTGWAMAYRHHSTAYVDEENEARLAKRGIWRGRFENPKLWRDRHRTMRGALGSVAEDD